MKTTVLWTLGVLQVIGFMVVEAGRYFNWFPVPWDFRLSVADLLFAALLLACFGRPRGWNR